MECIYPFGVMVRVKHSSPDPPLKESVNSFHQRSFSGWLLSIDPQCRRLLSRACIGTVSELNEALPGQSRASSSSTVQQLMGGCVKILTKTIFAAAQHYNPRCLWPRISAAWCGGVKMHVSLLCGKCIEQKLSVHLCLPLEWVDSGPAAGIFKKCVSWIKQNKCQFMYE